MKLILLLIFISTLISVKSQVSDRGTYKFEFSRPSNKKLNEHGSKYSSPPNHHSGTLKPNVGFYKRPLKVPSYAVPMDPLVHYSQPDPLYIPEKQPSNVTTALHKNDNDLIKKTHVENESKEKGYPPNQINSKSDTVSAYEDNSLGANRRIAGYHYPKPTWQPEPPEPIIEIIIKESNITLPPPPPPPTTPKPKRKKEPVQVFYVKYEKVPSDGYGEDKLIYDPPVPAITPPTNNEDTNSHEYEDEPAPYPDPIEDVTYAPPPSTTLKAIIKPDSETYHGSGGLHITFGGPHDDDQQDNGYSYYPGDYHQQSAPQPSVVFPGHGKSSAVSRASSDTQPTKRNPSPSQPTPTHESPQPVLDNVARPTQTSIVSSQEFPRPTPLPTYQQAPQFAAQSFHTKFSRPAQVFNNQPILQNQPPQGTVNIPRAQPTQAYTSLPQNGQLHKIQPGHHIFTPPRSSHVQSTAQPPQQYHTINQQNLRQNFQINVRPTAPQQYHTINHHTLPPNNFHSVTSPTSRFLQASITPSSPFVQKNQINQQRLFDSRPQNNFHSQRLSQSQQSFANFQQHQSHLQSQTGQAQAQAQPRQPQTQIQSQFNHFRLGPQQPVQPKVQQQPLRQIQHSLPARTQQSQHHTQQQANYQSDSSPEIIKSISPDITFAKNAFEIPKLLASTQKPAFLSTVKSGPQFSTAKSQYQETQKPYVVEYRTTTVKPFVVEYRTTTERKPLVVEYRTTPEVRSHSKSTPPPVQYVTEDPKKVEEERRKKEEKRKQNVAALPKEVPDDLREQLLSSGILGNADIQILDYDKIGDIPIENLPPEALANFQQVAGSAPKPVVIAAPAGIEEDSVPAASEHDEVTIGTSKSTGDAIEMKVVRFNPDSREGAVIAGNYMKEGATQLDPVVLNDSKYNRYLPLKVSGAQFPVPDVPELRGRNVTSVVVLAPVDYEFLQTRDSYPDSISRSAGPVLEVQGVHFIAGDVLKNLVKIPTAENYRRWLEKENSTSIDKQSVVLLVLEPLDGSPAETKEIFMYDIGTQKVSKLKGELSSTFVEVAESNSQNEDLEEISDGPSAPGGDFTIKDTSGVVTSIKRSQRKARRNADRS